MIPAPPELRRDELFPLDCWMRPGSGLVLASRRSGDRRAENCRHFRLRVGPQAVGRSPRQHRRSRLQRSRRHRGHARSPAGSRIRQLRSHCGRRPLDRSDRRDHGESCGRRAARPAQGHSYHRIARRLDGQAARHVEREQPGQWRLAPVHRCRCSVQAGFSAPRPGVCRI